MSKKKGTTHIEEVESVEAADQTPFTAVRSANGGSWQYYDQAGRLYRGYATEENAQAAADAHTPLANDPTLDAE